MAEFEIRKLVAYDAKPDHYFDIPAHLPEIEEPSQELAAKITALVANAAALRLPVAFAGGHFYDRKGYFSVDELGGQRNTSYGSASDEIALQITVRVSQKDAEEIIDLAATAIEDRALAAIEAQRRELDAQRRNLDAQIADLEARRSKLQ